MRSYTSEKKEEEIVLFTSICNVFSRVHFSLIFMKKSEKL